MKTIVAISTPYGTGGIAVVRLSGPDAIGIADKAWKGRPLAEVTTHTAHLGSLVDLEGNAVDQCVATVFRGPKSFTGEDTVEFSLHGSRWIQQKAVEALIAFGASPANPGEFTQRAFINGKLDLAQAEAVADLISSSSRAAHTLAMRQMDGSFSSRLEELRSQLIELASLLELELDFSEEDVEFADRSRLSSLTDTTLELIERLASTYRAGRAFKEGVPVVIAGAPNAGKSTLLNCLLQTDKAIVSDIPGTTRDIIEDTIEIDGILFRFLDTAGLRDTDDRVERIGIDRARQALDRAAIVIWLLDPTAPLAPQQTQLSAIGESLTDATLITLLTKQDVADMSDMSDASEVSEVSDVSDVSDASEVSNVSYVKHTTSETSGTSDATKLDALNLLPISALTGRGIPELKARLKAAATAGHNPDSELIITNARHHAELLAGAAALRRVRAALAVGLSSDLIAQDVREALHHLGLLTGAVTTDTLLATIFSTFCIGK